MERDDFAGYDDWKATNADDERIGPRPVEVDENEAIRQTWRRRRDREAM